MLTSALFIFVHFLATRPLTALLVPLRIHLLSLTMAVFSTVLPTYLIAEAIKRMGANRTSLLGSLGPLFTIGLGAWLLDEAGALDPACRRGVGSRRRRAGHAAPGQDLDPRHACRALLAYRGRRVASLRSELRRQIFDRAGRRGKLRRKIRRIRLPRALPPALAAGAAPAAASSPDPPHRPRRLRR